MNTSKQSSRRMGTRTGRFGLCLGLLALISTILGLRTLASPHAVAADAGRPLLIKHGWDVPQPQFVHDNVAKMEQVGFDGVVIGIPSGMNIFSQTPLSYDQLKSELAPLAATKFTTMTHNFVIIYRGNPGPWDGNWATPLSNIGNLAKAAKEVGLEGILYDNEDYSGTNSAFWPSAAPNLTLAQAQDAVRSRGREVGNAIASNWPTATVLTMFGPWASDPATATAITSMPYPNVDWANQLLGPFFIGMVDAAQGTKLTIADGGELYSARTPADFAQFYNWNKTGMATSGTQVPASLAPNYAASVSVGFTVYDQPAYGRSMDVNVWQTTLTNALKQADRYVVAYTELFDWWGLGWPSTPVPADWVAAAKAAILAGAGPRPISVVTPNDPSANTPVNNTPVNNTPVNNTPVNNTPVNNTPVNNTPTNNTPTNNTPTNNTPTNNQTTDVTPPVVVTPPTDGTTPVVGGTPDTSSDPSATTPNVSSPTDEVGSEMYSQTPDCTALRKFYGANGAGNYFLAHHPECRRAVGS